MAVQFSNTFLLRKLHQLTGIVPLGAFFFVHMFTNSTALNGAASFNEHVATIHDIPYLLLLEIFGIFLPLLFHSIYGILISAESKPNVQNHSKKPARATNFALGNMVFFAQDLGFTVKSAKNSTVDTSKIAARIEGQLTGIRQLYRQEVTVTPALAGSLVLQFQIAPNGEVSQVRELSSRIADGEFRKAVAAEVLKWSFAEIVTEHLQVTSPLLFVHEGMDINSLVHWEKALAEPSEKPSVARPANGSPGPSVKTAPAAAPSSPGSAPKRAKAEGQEFQIKYATALRKDPNFYAPSLTTLTIGTRVAVLNRPGEWLEVRALPNGPTGFIRKEFIIPLEVAHQ